MFCNTGVGKSLSCSSPDSQKSIILVKRESALICGQNSAPLLLGPSDMLPSPVETDPSVSRGEWDTLSWPSGMHIASVKSVTDCLSGNNHSSCCSEVIIEVTCTVKAVAEAEICQEAII